MFFNEYENMNYVKCSALRHFKSDESKDDKFSISLVNQKLDENKTLKELKIKNRSLLTLKK